MVYTDALLTVLSSQLVVNLNLWELHNVSSIDSRNDPSPKSGVWNKVHFRDLLSTTYLVYFKDLRAKLKEKWNEGWERSFQNKNQMVWNQAECTGLMLDCIWTVPRKFPSLCWKIWKNSTSNIHKKKYITHVRNETLFYEFKAEIAVKTISFCKKIKFTSWNSSIFHAICYGKSAKIFHYSDSMCIFCYNNPSNYFNNNHQASTPSTLPSLTWKRTF